ncbi:MAG: hypothetical protein WBL80_06790, partial [Erysipelotrichaceae bacterium]
MPSVTLFPSSHTLGTNGSNFLNPTNLRANDGVYCTVTAAAKNITSQIFLEGFAHSIPAGSTINSIIANVERKMSTTSSIQSVAIQVYKAAVAMGTKTTNTTEPSADTVLSNANTGAWTYDDLANLRVLLENIRGNSTVACTISYDYVSVTVDYTEPVDIRYSTGSFSVVGGFDGSAIKLGNVDGSFDVIGAFSGTAIKMVEVNGSFDAAGDFTGQSFRLVIASGSFASSGSFGGDGMKISLQEGFFDSVGYFTGQAQKTALQAGSFDVIGSF